jgi:DNA modification methylase
LSRTLKNWSSRSTKVSIIRELAAAEQNEMQALRHLRNAGEEWLNVKAELGERGINIAEWCKKNMPISRQWLDRHAELYKHWRSFLDARRWATKVGFISSRQTGLEFALELIEAKNRSDSDPRESRLAANPVAEPSAASSEVSFLTGDALTVLRTLPSCSHSVCVTSPPYFGGVRDYGNSHQIGREGDPEGYIAKLTGVFDEVRRTLTDTGVLWLLVGDTTIRKNWLLIPARLALSLCKQGWILRAEVIWDKGAGRPESARDRPTRSHEIIYLFSKSRSYWYDGKAIKEPLVSPPHAPRNRPRDGAIRRETEADVLRTWGDADGRNARSVWRIPVSPYPGAHPATFPAELVRRCLEASCPPGGRVLDPFGGAGTSGLVAVELGLQATLIDINPAYTKEARTRIAAKVRKSAGSVSATGRRRRGVNAAASSHSPKARLSLR